MIMLFVFSRAPPLQHRRHHVALPTFPRTIDRNHTVLPLDSAFLVLQDDGRVNGGLSRSPFVLAAPRTLHLVRARRPGSGFSGRMWG